jgi:hypothetical protein
MGPFHVVPLALDAYIYGEYMNIPHIYYHLRTRHTYPHVQALTFLLNLWKQRHAGMTTILINDERKGPKPQINKQNIRSFYFFFSFFVFILFQSRL